MVWEFNVITWNWKQKTILSLFLLSWSSKWDGPSTANFVTLCHALKQMHWFTSSEPLDLFLITFHKKWKNREHSEKFPNKIPQTSAGQSSEDHTCRTEFQNKKFVNCSIPESSQSHLWWKIIFLLAFLPLSIPNHADYIDWEKKCPLVPSLPHPFLSKNYYSHAVFQKLSISFLKRQFWLDQSIQVTFGHSQGAAYNMEIKLNVVLGKSMSIRGEGASNKADSSTKRTYMTPFSVTL